MLLFHVFGGNITSSVVIPPRGISPVQTTDSNPIKPGGLTHLPQYWKHDFTEITVKISSI